MNKPTNYNGAPQRVALRAPAKINLCLHVLGRRPNGYHELAMLMQAVSLYDEIELTLSPGDAVSVVCDGLTLVDGEENIVGKAARLLLEAVGTRARVEIQLHKKIPVAAGLGGGSSDAAAVLNGLNALLGSPLNRAQLQPLALQLGADVPFFVDGVPAWATGIGEVLTPAPKLPPLTYVLINPGIAVSTPWVYQNLALTSFSDAATFPELFPSPEAVVRLMHNTLETVTIPAVPIIQKIKDDLVRLGALGALMSGSGATVFGVFDCPDRAARAADALKNEDNWRVFVVTPVNGESSDRS